MNLSKYGDDACWRINFDNCDGRIPGQGGCIYDLSISISKIENRIYRCDAFVDLCHTETECNLVLLHIMSLENCNYTTSIHILRNSWGTIYEYINSFP